MGETNESPRRGRECIMSRSDKVESLVKAAVANGADETAARIAAEAMVPKSLSDLEGTMGLPVGKAGRAIFPFTVESVTIENGHRFEGYTANGMSKCKVVYAVVSRDLAKRTTVVLARDAKDGEIPA